MEDHDHHGALTDTDIEKEGAMDSLLMSEADDERTLHRTESRLGLDEATYSLDTAVGSVAASSKHDTGDDSVPTIQVGSDDEDQLNTSDSGSNKAWSNHPSNASDGDFIVPPSARSWTPRQDHSPTTIAMAFPNKLSSKRIAVMRKTLAEVERSIKVAANEWKK